MPLLYWLWIFASCFLAVSLFGFALLVIDRLQQNRRNTAMSAARTAILGLLAQGHLSNERLKRQVAIAERHGSLGSVILEALSLVAGAPRRVFLNRLESAGAAHRLRRHARRGRRHSRLVAIQALAAFTDDRSTSCLVRLWRDFDDAVRLGALGASLGGPSAPGFETVVAAASATPPHLRGRAQRLIRAAALIHHRESAHALMRRELPTWLRLQLAESLHCSHDPAVIPALLAAAHDPEAELRAAAIGALAASAAPEGMSAILDAINDTIWLVRVRAVSAAGKLRLEAARAFLMLRLEDANWWVRLRAREALGLLDESGQARVPIARGLRP